MNSCLAAEQLRSLLESEDEGSPAEWLLHLDQCDACRVRLENLAGDVRITTLQSDISSVVPKETRESLYSLIVVENQNSQAFRASTPGSHLLTSSARPGCIGMFGEYPVLEVLGAGGMGIVFKAIEPILERTVAIKVLAPQLAAVESARRRFVAEARSIAKLSHANVIGIHQVSELDGTPFIVMPCIEGGSLDDQLQDGRRFTPEQVVAIAKDVGSGLCAAHEARVVHRDIKPANLLVASESGEVVVTDFGLARAADDESLTRTGFVAGTPHYMAPEQAQGGEADERSDLYSLGMVMYTLLAGRPAFKAVQPLALLHKVLHEQPPSLAEIVPNVPTWLAQLIDRLLVKSPDERVQSATELIACLDACKGDLRRESALTLSRKSVSDSTSPLFGNSKQLLALASFILVLAGVWFGTRAVMRAWGQPANQALAKSTSDGAAATNQDVASLQGESSLSNPLEFEIRFADGTEAGYPTLMQALENTRAGAQLQFNSAGPYSVNTTLLTSFSAVSSSLPGGTEIAVQRTERDKDDYCLIRSDLLLRNLEVSLPTSESKSSTYFRIAEGGSVQIRNCVVKRDGQAVEMEPGGELTLADSVLIAGNTATAVSMPNANATKFSCANSLVVAKTLLEIWTAPATRAGGEVALHDSTIATQQCFVLDVDGPLGLRDAQLKLEARGNVFQSDLLLGVQGINAESVAMLEVRSRGQFEQRVAWRGDFNLFALSEGYCGFWLRERGFVLGRGGPRDLDSWKELRLVEGDGSAQAATSVLGKVDDVFVLNAQRLNLEPFKLVREHSAGTFGARIDTLGPSPARAD